MFQVAGVFALVAALLMAPGTKDCPKDLKDAGLCPWASNQGSSVQVEASKTQQGSDFGSGGSGGSGGGGKSLPKPRPIAPVPGNSSDVCTPLTTVQYCGGDPTIDPATPAIPDITLADIATFVPARPTLANEPAGLGVVGMPTNFVSTAGEQAIGGRLFDTWDVTVYFTPAGYRFDYGDGTSQSTTSGGASWTALGQAEFTPTATSHAYTARGTYTVGVTVLYTAVVDFGSGIQRVVPGYVQATTSGYGVRIVEVHTALVDKTCLENPAGPGC